MCMYMNLFVHVVSLCLVQCLKICQKVMNKNKKGYEQDGHRREQEAPEEKETRFLNALRICLPHFPLPKVSHFDYYCGHVQRR